MNSVYNVTTLCASNIISIDNNYITTTIIIKLFSGSRCDSKEEKKLKGLLRR